MSIEECNCKPFNEEMIYTGDCKLHSTTTIAEVTMESLRSSNHPEAEAVLNLINQEITEARIDELKKLPPYMFDAYPSLTDRLAQLTKPNKE